MKYFNIINCKNDPFPGFPTLALYSPAAPHEKCLENILTIIKEKMHPMAVVHGETGIGKTTIYLQLREKLENNPAITLTSVDDSWFISREIFIERLAEFLNISTQGKPTDNDLHNCLKSAITKKDSSAKHQHVLLIDQAENIPLYCIELFEELFTEKANAGNLQIIAFGREIFKDKINLYFNLAQNSYLIQFPRKLNFDHITKLLEHYLKESGSSLNLDSLISKAGQYYIYLLVKGHPGKALDFCKLIILNQVIQNRSKAGIVLCHKTAKEIFPERAIKFEIARVFGLATVTACLLIYLTATTQTPDLDASTSVAPKLSTNISSPLKIDQKLAEMTSLPEVPTENSNQPTPNKQAEDSSDTNQLELPKELLLETKSERFSQSDQQATIPKDLINISSTKVVPELLGKITVFEQETLGDMIRRLYGPYSFNRANTEKVLAINPHVKDKHSIRIGDIIKFPSLAVNLTPQASYSWWIRLVKIDKLQDAYRFLRIYGSQANPLLIIPTWTEKGSLNFSIVLQNSFDTQNDAKNKLKELSSNVYPAAELLKGLSHESYYYAEKAKVTGAGSKQSQVINSKVVNNKDQKRSASLDTTKITEHLAISLPMKELSSEPINLKKTQKVKKEKMPS